MARAGLIERNNYRRKLVEKEMHRRMALKSIIMNKSIPFFERFRATLKLSSLNRNGSRTRVRNRCEVTGRSRGFYRKFRISRIILRDLASEGKIPGMIKASW